MTSNIVRRSAVITDGSNCLGAYMACPAGGGPYPSVIVGMELFGVTQHIRHVTDKVAALGYLAIAPDFYHRAEAGAELPYDAAGRSKGFALLHQVTRSDAVRDVQAVMRFVRQQPRFRGRIGFLGFSVGGHIGYLAATQMDLAACAIFYAGWLANTDIELSQPEPTLSLTPGIARHGGCVIYFVGEQDILVTPSQRQEIANALIAAKVRHEMVVYPGVQHGFFCDERETFDKMASSDAWMRTQALFLSELGTPP